jgi:hypothetical protein
LTIGPWAVVILCDILLYIWRASTYEIPIVGGRARGRQRPLIPSLTELPRTRSTWSQSGTTYNGTGDEDGSAQGEYDTGEGEDDVENEDEVRNRKACKHVHGNRGGVSTGE